MNTIKKIICISFALFLSACGNNESAQSYIAQAEALLVKEENKSAIISLKNAIKIDTKNVKARFLLGQLYLSLGNADGAVKELSRAYDLQHDKNQVIPLLARAYMLIESDDDVILLDEQIDSLNDPAKTQYLAYKVLAALRTGDENLAKETMALAFSISETDGYSTLAQAYIEFSNKNIPRASALVSRILAAKKESPDALMLQGQISSVEKNYQQAVDSFKEYQVLQPESGKVQLFIADALLKNGQFVEAEVIADSILAKIPTQPFLQYIKAMVRFEDKDYKEASNYANLSLTSGFNSFSLRLVAGASAFYLKNYDQCHAQLKDLVSYLPVDHSARRMLAISQLKLGLIDDISETLNGYDASTKESSQFLATLSYELLEVGAIDKARKMAKQISAVSDANAEQSARAGVLKLMMNDPSGVENLELALQLNPELISAELALAFASVNSGDLDRAKSIATKWQKKYPKKAGGYNLEATIAFKEKKFAQGRTALEKSLQLEPNNVYALTEMVKLAYFDKDLEKAKILTEKAVEIHPNNIKVLGQYFSFHQDDKGLIALKNAQKLNEKNIAYGVLLAEALIKLKKYKQANELLTQYFVDAKTPKRYWQLALIANWNLKDSKDTFTILDQWRKNNTYHIEPIFLLVDYWVAKKVPDRALSVVNRGFKQFPNHVILKLVKMQLLLNGNKLEEAKKLQKELKLLDVDKNLMAGIDGRIFLLEKNFSAAVPKLNQLFEARPNSKNVIYLALALEGNNQKDEAIKLLANFSAQDTKALSPQLALANMYLANQRGKALLEYEKFVQKQPENIVALNNLSWLHMEKGNFSKALTYAKQAYDLNAKIANVVDTYAQVLLKLNQTEQALIKAEEAYKLSKGKDIDIALNYVEILIANDKKTEAKIQLTNITVRTIEQGKKQQLLQKKL